MPSKITYEGFVEKDGIPHICFKRDGLLVVLPIDPTTAEHIKLRLNSAFPGELNPVERGNESDS